MKIYCYDPFDGREIFEWACINTNVKTIGSLSGYNNRQLIVKVDPLKKLVSFTNNWDAFTFYLAFKNKLTYSKQVTDE